MPSDTPEHLFFVSAERLSDGSYAHNVIFGDLVFHAVDRAQAIELADRLADAINDCTVDTASTVIEADPSEED